MNRLDASSGNCDVMLCVHWVLEDCWSCSSWQGDDPEAVFWDLTRMLCPVTEGHWPPSRPEMEGESSISSVDSGVTTVTTAMSQTSVFFFLLIYLKKLFRVVSDLWENCKDSTERTWTQFLCLIQFPPYLVPQSCWALVTLWSVTCQASVFMEFPRLHLKC